MNPNGSFEGIAGATSADGRITMLMPHPERVHRTAQHSWAPEEWGEDGPWLRMFRNALENSENALAPIQNIIEMFHTLYN